MNKGGVREGPGLWARFKSWFVQWQQGYFVPLPVSSWEWFLMRLFFSGVVFYTFLDELPYKYETQKAPNGIANFVSLTFLHGEHVHQTIQIIVSCVLLIYLSGFRLALLVSLPVLTLCSVLVRTYANSQGFIHHGHQVVTLVLLAQTIVVSYVCFRNWFGKSKWIPKAGLSLQSYMVYYSQGVILALYFLAAISKTANSKGMWIWNARYISLDLVKSHRTTYYKSLDPKLAEFPAVADWMLNHPMMASAIFGSGFFLELFALMGLRNRPWALLVGISLILLHKGIFLIMSLRFFYNESLLLIFFVNLPFWIVWVWRKCQKAAV